MIGIYKITNNINGKIYIGQSNNIKRRFSEHKTKGAGTKILVDGAIQKYGADNFSFEIIEECNLEQLNEKESFWINYYKQNNILYNLSEGGDNQSRGINNGRAILTEDDIRIIRNAYNNHKIRKEIYEQFKDKISFSTFANIWDGSSWSHIMPEVFTEENKKYYMIEASRGEKSTKAIFSDKEVVQIRERYVSESAKQIYQDYKEKCNFQSLQQILWGRTYSHLPIYKKKEKKWINK